MNKLLTVLAVGAVAAGCATDDGASSGGATSASGDATTTVVVATGPEPGSAEDFVVNAGDRVFFDTDRFNVKPEAAATLDRQIAWLDQFAQRAAILEGHTDDRGTREYNQALGERRANAVFDYMTARGVAQIRLATISYGELRPAVLGQNPAAWAQNRRVVTVIE